MDQSKVLSIAREYADAVRQIMDTDAIFLYGSHDRGAATKDSDIDIAVVVDRIPDDPATAAAMETIRQNIIVFNYGLSFVQGRRKDTKEYVGQATRKYSDYKDIRSQIKAKAKKRGKLQKGACRSACVRHRQAQRIGI